MIIFLDCQKQKEISFSFFYHLRKNKKRTINNLMKHVSSLLLVIRLHRNKNKSQWTLLYFCSLFRITYYKRICNENGARLQLVRLLDILKLINCLRSRWHPLEIMFVVWEGTLIDFKKQANRTNTQERFFEAFFFRWLFLKIMRYFHVFNPLLANVPSSIRP